jgi:hypothetical protein
MAGVLVGITVAVFAIKVRDSPSGDDVSAC